MCHTFCTGVLEFIHKEVSSQIQPRCVYLTNPFFKTLKFSLVQGHTLRIILMVAGVLRHYIILYYIIYLYYITLLWYFATCTVLIFQSISITE